MSSGGVAIAALPTVICLKVLFSDGLGGLHVYKRVLKLVQGVLQVYKKVLKLVQGAFARVQKGIEQCKNGLVQEQFGLEVSSRRFCAVNNLRLKLLQSVLRTL